jgi:hypothetical protein
MDIKKEIFNFCKIYDIKVVDNSRFSFLNNELLFTKGGKIIDSILTLENDNINELIKEKNNYYLRLKYEPQFSENYNNIICVIGVSKLYEIRNFEIRYQIKEISSLKMLTIFLKSFFGKYLDTKNNESDLKINDIWLPAWNYLYDTLFPHFDVLSIKDRLKIILTNDALVDKTIICGSFNCHLKTIMSSDNIEGTERIYVDLLPLTFKLGYYHKSRFIERFTSLDKSSIFTPNYFEKIFYEDVKVYEYSIKIIGFQLD